MKIITIARDPVHSHGMENNDAAILRCVEEELIARGCQVKRLTILSDSLDNCDAICQMTRNAATLEWLKKRESEGTVVINSPAAVEGCSRIKAMETLKKAEVTQPFYKVITNKEQLQGIDYPGWIKKGEGWSCRKEDVSFVTNETEAGAAFDAIDTDKAVYCRHIEGDIIKFYGVAGSFFSYSYPDPEKTKYQLEKINGTPHRYLFSQEKLKKTAFDAAASIGLEIFGGDCIITPAGDIYIIDINDFPSFTAVRKEAALHIAKKIIDSTRKDKQ